MRIARPPNGFRIIEKPTVTQLIEAESVSWPRLKQHWIDIKERLKFVAHKEGTEDRRLGPGHRIFKAAGYPDFGIPTVRLVYHVLGDQVTIVAAAVLDSRT